MTLSATHYSFLYTATLIVHVIFMNYVLGGTAYLAYRSLRRRIETDAIVETARDWMPFALSAAITAGIAPLLFLQLLHQHAFYTANTLLFHRWMSIVPVLIVGFYLLYLLKSRPWHSKATPFLAVGSFLCIAWTGLSWTENHLLSIQSKDFWANFYESKAMWFRDPRVGLRFAVWLFGSLPAFTMLIGWQLWIAQRRGLPYGAQYAELLGRLAVTGGLVSVVAGTIYFICMPKGVAVITGGWVAVVLVPIGSQYAIWNNAHHAKRLRTGGLVGLTVLVLASIVGATQLREAVRTVASNGQTVDVPARAGTVSGFALFTIFLILSGLLIAWCLRIAFRRSRPA